MSIAIMNWVWANSPTSGNERLALADACSRDDGTGCLPSAATIGRKANLSDRTVPRVIARLEADGHVVVHRGMAASPPPDQRSKTHADHRAGIVPVAAGQVIGQRARAELRACGVSVPAAEPGGLAELTRSNARSATWPAAISTNREIGDRLFLSSRTVISHLHRSFPKLAVTARHQLRDVVAQAGMPSAADQNAED